MPTPLPIPTAATPPIIQPRALRRLMRCWSGTGGRPTWVDCAGTGVARSCLPGEDGRANVGEVLPRGVSARPSLLPTRGVKGNTVGTSAALAFAGVTCATVGVSGDACNNPACGTAGCTADELFATVGASGAAWEIICPCTTRGLSAAI